MIKAGIKHVKNNLSRLLVQVKDGEEIVITKRGRPIARIVKENREGDNTRAVLDTLAREGLITLPTRSIVKDHVSAAKVPGKPVSKMIIEDRR